MLQVFKMFHAVSEFVSYCKKSVLLRHKADVTKTSHGRSEANNSISPQECLIQIDHMVSSPLLYGSEALSKLLQYLAHHTLNSPADHLKEYQIATEVLGRPSEFDPQSDSSVRVQVGRLRTKLAEYYNSIGAQDPILVDVPKGRYALSFERRGISFEKEATSKTTDNNIPSAPPPRPRHNVVLNWMVLANILLLCGNIVYLLHYKSVTPVVPHSGTVHPPSALLDFWSPFLGDHDDSFVIYSNAAFVGDPVTGMHYYDSTRDSRDQVSQYYTGVGEVMGVLELDRLFRGFGRQFHVKRGGIFTLDDALNNNLIFLGSPVEDPPQNKIPTTSQFVFRRLQRENSPWWAIIDLHPQAGDTGTYRSTLQPARQVGTDFAIIALVTGLNPARRILILEGISTFGTQAAVDYVCNEASMRDLLGQLHTKSGGVPPPFEALLQIEVVNNVPLKTRLIVLRHT
jgi:hypothetical protein